MQVQLTKTEHGSILTLPDTWLQEAHWSPEAIVDVTLRDGKMLAAPIAEREETLDEMLARVTPDNLHAETDWGLPVGREAF